MKKFFAFLWKWPLPILGVLALMFWPYYGVVSTIQNLHYEYYVYPRLKSPVETWNVVEESKAPDGVVSAMAVEYFIDGDLYERYIHLSDVAPNSQDTLFFFKTYRPYFEDKPFNISFVWESNDAITIRYCNVKFSTLSNYEEVFLQGGNTKTIEVDLARDIACEIEEENDK